MPGSLAAKCSTISTSWFLPVAFCLLFDAEQLLCSKFLKVKTPACWVKKQSYDSFVNELQVIRKLIKLQI